LRQNAARPQALFQAGLKPLKFHDRVLGVLRPILNRHRLCALPQHLLTGETYAQSEPDIVRYWEIIADNLKRAGWSLGYVSAVDFEGERSGLQTRIVATGSVSLCVRMKS